MNALETPEARIARLEERHTAMAADLAEIKTDQKTQIGILNELKDAHAQRKGATKMFKAVAGIASSTGFVGWLWEHFHK